MRGARKSVGAVTLGRRQLGPTRQPGRRRSTEKMIAGRISSIHLTTTAWHLLDYPRRRSRLLMDVEEERVQHWRNDQAQKDSERQSEHEAHRHRPEEWVEEQRDHSEDSRDHDHAHRSHLGGTSIEE